MSDTHYVQEACSKGVHSWQWVNHERKDNGVTKMKIRWCLNCETLNTSDDPRETVWAESNEGILSRLRRRQLRLDAGLNAQSEYDGVAL